MKKIRNKWEPAEMDCSDLNRLFEGYINILNRGEVVDTNCPREGCPVKLRVRNVYWHGVFPLGKAELLSEGCVRAKERR